MDKRVENRSVGIKTVMRACKLLEKKRLSEDVNGTAEVRGLGLVSGNPMADEDEVSRYQARNSQEADTQNDVLNKRLERWGLRSYIDHTKSINTKKAKGTL